MILQSVERSPRLNRPPALEKSLLPRLSRPNPLNTAGKPDISALEPFCRTPTLKSHKSIPANMSTGYNTAVGLGICNAESTAPMPTRKRSAPSLLPPFEPLSSSPRLPRPAKRQNRGGYDYPTPAATSSTGILSSSPPRGVNPAHLSHALSRIQQARASKPSRSAGSDTKNDGDSASATSDRAPLSTVPSVELPESGSVVRMGRSSISSHFQLSANRLISRVHIEARYIAASAPLEPNRVEIVCKGWNDVNVHCPGRTYTLHRGDSFTSEEESTQIMLDVQDARVLVLWPKRAVTPAAPPMSEWDASPSPAARRRQTMAHAVSDAQELASSPFRAVAGRLRSPVSPSPATAHALSGKLQALMPQSRASPNPEDSSQVHIYEDEPELPLHSSSPRLAVDPDATIANLVDSFSSDLSDPEDDLDEYDSVAHSFDSFPANIEDPFTSTPKTSKLASIHENPSAESKTPSRALYAPVQTPIINPSHTLPSVLSLDNLASITYPHPRSSPPRLASASPAPPSPIPGADEIAHHAINQLAFSRLSSTPLSTLLANLPAAVHSPALTRDAFERVLADVPSVGIIPRHGKDAAGKLLESEYYYVPEKDEDQERRAVVGGLRKPSLRACRKQHKQYYWKRPKTP
ncbi:hypothetical protein BROUX41_005966 [Berkeleyomyces rouxiae]|uniref:uncharacterized protein n=1 Tax=Berkeleyomyces rouxiae TaxID=2035830 RepID=UPI003B781C72